MKTQDLTKDIQGLLEGVPRSKLQVADLIRVLGDRSFGFALILFSIPSALPIPAPGYSIPLGILLMGIAFQMVVGRQQIWLPKRVQGWSFSSKPAQKFLGAFLKAVKLIEFCFQPRLVFICSGLGIRLFGVLVMGLASLMLIPLPFTNSLPALIILLLGLGLAEDDGLFSIGVAVVGVLVLTFYLLILFYGLQFGIEGLKQILNSIRESFF